MKTPILILHGWSKTMTGTRYTDLATIFRKHGYEVLIPDLPGFGTEPLVCDPMTLDDYVLWVVKFLKKEKLKKIILIGHSFGGRIAARLAYEYPRMVERLVLTGAPLVAVPLSFKKQIISRSVRLMKGSLERLPLQAQGFLRKGLYYFIGEFDYYQAGHLKGTFKNIISSDVSGILGRILMPTLIVWGNLDTFVPVTVGKQIAAKISGAEFIIIPNATHKLPYENAQIFGEYILEWMDK